MLDKRCNSLSFLAFFNAATVIFLALSRLIFKVIGFKFFVSPSILTFSFLPF